MYFESKSERGANVSADDMVMAWLREFAAEALVPGTLDGLVARFDAAIVAEVPEVSADRELRRDLDASTRGQGRALLIWLTDDPAEVDLPLAAHDLARTIARRGLHLRVLMQIYRVGQKALLRFAAETASERITDPVLEPKVLIRLLERANHWLNVSLEILTDTYSEERERGLSGAFARQAETVQAIIRGEIVDAAAASNRLNYPLIRHNTALVLWFDNVPSEQTEDVIGVLNSVVRAVAATIGALGVAVDGRRVGSRRSGHRCGYPGRDIDRDGQPRQGNSRISAKSHRSCFRSTYFGTSGGCGSPDFVCRRRNYPPTRRPPRRGEGTGFA